MRSRLQEAIGNGKKNALIKKKIFTHYINNGNTTLTALAKSLGLSVPTTTKFVDELCSDGFIQAYGKLETNGGRHPLLYGLKPDSGYFIGVDVKHFTLSIGIIDLNGVFVDQQLDIKYKFENSPAGLDLICDEILAFINTLDIDHDKILNINVNISGRVNPKAGYSYSYFNFSERPLTELLEERLGYPISIDNDTRAMTYGEYTCGVVKSQKNVLFINVSWGLGMGIIIDGKVYLGKSGFAGEFGHIPCFNNEIMCHCGKKGCLETEVSGSALIRKMEEHLKNGEISCLSATFQKKGSLDMGDLITAINKEDVLCIDLIEEIGIKLGKQIAGIINVFNPEIVVVGGMLAIAGDYLLQPILTTVRKHSLNMVNKDTQITISKLAGDAGLVGSCKLSRAHLFEQ